MDKHPRKSDCPMLVCEKANECKYPNNCNKLGYVTAASKAIEKITKMKYVIVMDELGIERAIFFPESLVHIEVAFFYHRNERVLSAGFCYIDGNKVYIEGRSESLHVDSRSEDVTIIKQTLGIKDAVRAA